MNVFEDCESALARSNLVVAVVKTPFDHSIIRAL